MLTVIDEASINPQYIVDWFVKMRDEEGYDLQRIVSDNFRMEILKPLFEREGFEVLSKTLLVRHQVIKLKLLEILELLIAY